MMRSADTWEDWRHRPLAELMDHLVNHHHAYARKALMHIETLVDGGDGPLGEAVAGLAVELRRHLAKEEQVMFPWIAGLMEGRRVFPFGGSLELPSACLRHDHEAIDGLMATALERAGADARILRALEALDCDLRRHVRLENDVLFPRAIQLEDS